MNKIAFIGMGNMGFAMLKGAMSVFDPKTLIYTDVNEERLKWVKAQTHIEYVQNNVQCVEQSKIIILAIKPQYYEVVLNDIKDKVTENHIIVSIAPGITINKLKDLLGTHIRIVRAMPNTPALIGEGMTAFAYSKDTYTEDEKHLVEAFFASFSKFKVLEEKLMDSIVPITGSSPAYVFMFIEALADGAVKLGIPRAQAYEMVAQTVLGAAKMVLDTANHPAILKDQVCSPGGTTIDAVASLEAYGFRNAILQAVDSCYKKCQALS